MYIYLRQVAIPRLNKSIKIEYDQFNEFIVNLIRNGNIDNDRTHIRNIVRKASQNPSLRPYNISILYKAFLSLNQSNCKDRENKIKEDLIKYKMLSNNYVDILNSISVYKLNYFDFTKGNEANQKN